MIKLIPLRNSALFLSNPEGAQRIFLRVQVQDKQFRDGSSRSTHLSTGGVLEGIVGDVTLSRGIVQKENGDSSPNKIHFASGEGNVEDSFSVFISVDDVLFDQLVSMSKERGLPKISLDFDGFNQDEPICLTCSPLSVPA